MEYFIPCWFGSHNVHCFLSSPALQCRWYVWPTASVHSHSNVVQSCDNQVSSTWSIFDKYVRWVHVLHSVSSQPFERCVTFGMWPQSERSVTIAYLNHCFHGVLHESHILWHAPIGALSQRKNDIQWCKPSESTTQNVSAHWAFRKGAHPSDVLLLLLFRISNARRAHPMKGTWLYNNSLKVSTTHYQQKYETSHNNRKSHTNSLLF